MHEYIDIVEINVELVAVGIVACMDVSVAAATSAILARRWTMIGMRILAVRCIVNDCRGGVPCGNQCLDVDAQLAVMETIVEFLSSADLAHIRSKQ